MPRRQQPDHPCAGPRLPADALREHFRQFKPDSAGSVRNEYIRFVQCYIQKGLSGKVAQTPYQPTGRCRDSPGRRKAYSFPFPWPVSAKKPDINESKGAPVRQSEARNRWHGVFPEVDTGPFAVSSASAMHAAKGCHCFTVNLLHHACYCK